MDALSLCFTCLGIFSLRPLVNRSDALILRFFCPLHACTDLRYLGVAVPQYLLWVCWCLHGAPFSLVFYQLGEDQPLPREEHPAAVYGKDQPRRIGIE